MTRQVLPGDLHPLNLIDWYEPPTDEKILEYVNTARRADQIICATSIRTDMRKLGLLSAALMLDDLNEAIIELTTMTEYIATARRALLENLGARV